MTPPSSLHGVASSGKGGADTGVAGVSFRALDERGVAGLSAAVAGGAAGQGLPLRWPRVSRTSGLCAAGLPCMAVGWA